mmetsp:Transcript_56789/g.65065  ORF Transcript_56789/g.65065 Transcript_56789/m.65065 type:complete len:139 (-) Transcript_56789:87-503(-)
MDNKNEVRAVAAAALSFKTNYYQFLDKPEMRPKLLECYHPGASVLMEWNGHQLPTREAIQEYLTQLPKTNHTINTVDAQPLPGCENGDSILMTVSGTVVYDDEHKREFFQRFVLRKTDPQSTTLFIVNDYYRWLSDKS